jgi:proteasome lid subunit RPN8/RPN11
MRPVRVPGRLVEEIRQHARETYPDECCGFLVARPDPPARSEPRTIVAAERASNDFEGERRRRFVIRSEELRAAEHALEGTERVVAGFYHSHPDHPARPSAFDQEHAWPWYTYLVLSVTAAGFPAIGAFELDPDAQRFHEVPLRMLSADPEVTESLSAGGGR